MAEFVQPTLMDGYAGGPHITEAQLGLAHQATFGPDDYVLEGGRESEAQVLTNNSIRIFDAVYCIQGRRDVIPASGYTDVTIDNGTQGMNRNDIIVRRYKKDEVSEEESTEYAVIKGTPSSGEAVDPSVTTGDIRSGAILHEMKLYRVKLTGLNIVEVEPLFNILKNQATLQKEIAQSNKDLSNKLTELNGKIDKQKYKVGTVTLGYYDASYLYATIDLDTDQWNGCVVFTSMFSIRNTPYEQVISFSTTEVQGNKVTIWARGSGFVKGHSLLVGYLIIPKN